MTYFDHNATSPLSAAARQAWLEAADRFPGNPSSPHRIGTRADAALEQARAKLAGWLGCSPLEIVWTSGATESANLALHHFSRTLPESSEVWTSETEHPCVLTTVKRLFRSRVRIVPVRKDGTIDRQWLEERLRRVRPGLLAIMAANNETGVLQPWAEFAALCRDGKVPLLCDATQWLGRLPASGLGACEFVFGSGHKFGGPKGVGFLKCPVDAGLEPLLLGGHQQEGRRAGTENVPGVLSMIAALEDRESAIAAGGHGRREAWRDQFVAEMLRSLCGSRLVGEGGPRLWNTVSLVMPEFDCRQRWVVRVDKAGFAVSTGSACASGSEEPSHVLLAMGFQPAEAGRVLRFSSGWETAEADWQQLAAALCGIHETWKSSPKTNAMTTP